MTDYQSVKIISEVTDRLRLDHPLLKAVEFFEDGRIKRIELYGSLMPTCSISQPIRPRHVEINDDDIDEEYR